MNETREQILNLIESEELSAIEIAESLNLSAGAVRRHLDLLVADQLITSHIPRQDDTRKAVRGRPTSVFRLSDTSEMLKSAMDYRRLLARIARALESFTDIEVSGKDGTEILELVSERLAELVAADYASNMRAKTFEAKLVEVVSLLSEEGILRSIRTDKKGFILSTPSCPIKTLSRTTGAICEADRRSIELLIGTNVEQISTIAAGSHSCEYLIKHE
tara:strand:- start:664 stop:1317 length:654 start_codon:yes stop_codon:yes gene_type:complete